MQYKTFIVDYDGTFYRSEKELNKNMDLVKKLRQQGHQFMIATGRGHDSFAREMAKHQFEYDYLILCSGALILNKNNERLHHFSMSHHNSEKLNQIIKTYNDNLVSERYIYLDFVDQYYLPNEPLLKVAYTFQKQDKNLTLKKVLEEEFKDVFNVYYIAGTTHDYIEIIAKNIHKGIAIMYLRDLGLLNNEIFVLGDSENDLEMIDMFDGYLISNHQVQSKKSYKIIESFEKLIKVNVGKI